MKQFLATSGGRLLLLGLGIALVGGGAAVLGPESISLWFTALSFPISVALCILGLVMASMDSYEFAVRGAVTLPWALFGYVVLVGALAGNAPAGWVLLVSGGGLLAMAIRPRADAREMRPVTAQQH